MEKWKFKEYIKIIIRCEIVAFIFLAILELINLKLGEDIETVLKEQILLGILIFLILGFVFISPVAIFQLTSSILKKKNEIAYKELQREIDEKYTPAIASFLIDNNVEKNKDILATILDLINRKYLSLIKSSNIEINVENKNIENLYLHEKYIIESIMENDLISLYEFEKLVEQDCINEQLVKEINKEKKQINLIKLMFLEFFVILLLPGLINYFRDSWISWGLGLLVVSLFGITVAILRSVKSYNRTKKGEKIAAGYKGLQNYLKEYTLLKTRDVEYINIFDRYLTFALALEEADTIEKLYVPYNKLISKYIEGGKQ